MQGVAPLLFVLALMPHCLPFSVGIACLALSQQLPDSFLCLLPSWQDPPAWWDVQNGLSAAAAKLTRPSPSLLAFPGSQCIRSLTSCC